MKTVRILLALAALTVTSHAAAEDVVVVEAKQRMAEGKKLFGDGQFEAAWIKYKQACVVLKSDNCTRGLAITEYRAGKFVDAYQHTKELVEPTPKPSLTPPVVEELRRIMKESYSKIGHVEVTAPADSVLMLDGAEVGHAPLAEALPVSAGLHDLAAKVDGELQVQKVSVLAGEVVTLRFEGKPAETVVAVVPPQPAPSTPRIADEPVATSHGLKVPAGAWILGAGAVVALGLGTTFLIVANGSDSDAEALRGALSNKQSACAAHGAQGCSALVDNRSTYSEQRALEAGFYIGGAALLAGAVTWVVLANRSPQRDSAGPRFTPLLGPKTAGAMIGCDF